MWLLDSYYSGGAVMSGLKRIVFLPVALLVVGASAELDTSNHSAHFTFQGVSTHSMATRTVVVPPGDLDTTFEPACKSEHIRVKLLPSPHGTRLAVTVYGSSVGKELSCTIQPPAGQDLPQWTITANVTSRSD